MSRFTPEAITLSVYDKEAKKYGVTWQTEDKGTPVLKWANNENFDNEVTVAAEMLEGAGTVKNVAVIEGLHAEEKCFWKVGDETADEWSSVKSFKALSDDDSETEFFIMTDTQDMANFGEWWKAAWKDARKTFPSAQYVIHGGDFVQMSGLRYLWREMLSRNEEFIRSIPMMPVAGNHDYWECYLEGYRGTFGKHFHIEYPEQDTWTGVYYSRDIGPCHFTMLNSGDSVAGVGSGLSPWQLEWLIDDIKSSDKKWKIVVIHNPLYSPGKYGSALATNLPARVMRGQLDAILPELGVDLVISGHDHMYSKSYPVKNDGEPDTEYKYTTETFDGNEYKVTLNPSGPIHIIGGVCGNQNREIIDGIGEEYLRYFDDMLDMQWAHVSYSDVKINGDTLYFTYRMVSVESGECVAEKTFAVRKS